MKIRLMGFALLCALVTACTQFDDYMLGKDNTPIPKQLKPINSTVTLTKAWTVKVGKPQRYGINFNLKPLLSGNQIVVADASGQLQALNKKSGQVIWVNKTPYHFVSGPALSDGILVVATNNSEVLGYRQKDGQRLWERKLSGDVLAAPLIVGSKILAKTIDGNLYALDLHQGKILWHIDHGAPNLVLKASSSPVMWNNHIALVGYSDGKLDTVDTDTGHSLAERSIVYPTGASDVERLVDIDADPIIFDDTVILASYQGYIGAISLRDGQYLWQRPGSIYKNMKLQGNSLYFTDSHDVVWSIDKRTGRVNWKQPTLRARNLTEPALQGNRLFLGDKTGLLHGLDTSTGALVARVPMSGAVYVAPIVSDNRLYVLTSTSELSCYLVS